MSRSPIFPLATFVFATLALSTLARGQDEAIDFSRDIRPILSNNCFACHGPDEKQRQGGFRLDEKASALGKGESGEPVIVPGKPDTSGLIARITSDDADLKMPPADSKKHLKPEEIELLKKWVAGGADWKQHWAFVAPIKPKAGRASWTLSLIHI